VLFGAYWSLDELLQKYRACRQQQRCAGSACLAFLVLLLLPLLLL
jgi:hypothetical protein